MNGSVYVLLNVMHNDPKFMMVESYDIQCAIYFDANKLEILVARVGDGWIESVEESTVFVDLMIKGQDHIDTTGKGAQQLIQELAQVRDHLYEKYGMISVVIFAGYAMRVIQNRSELNWMIEEATGYRVAILTQEEELVFSLSSALQNHPINSESFDDLVKRIQSESGFNQNDQV